MTNETTPPPADAPERKPRQHRDRALAARAVELLRQRHPERARPAAWIRNADTLPPTESAT